MKKGQRTGIASGAALFLFAAVAVPAFAFDPLDTQSYAGKWRADPADVPGDVSCAPVDTVLSAGGHLVEIERASRDLIRMTVTRRSASGGRALDGPFIVSIASEDGRVVMTRPGRRDEVTMENENLFRLAPLDGGAAQIFRRCP